MTGIFADGWTSAVASKARFTARIAISYQPPAPPVGTGRCAPARLPGVVHVPDGVDAQEGLCFVLVLTQPAERLEAIIDGLDFVSHLAAQLLKQTYGLLSFFAA